MSERHVAIVTGGARGIGLGIATALADEGFDLVLCGRKAEKDVTTALESLRSHGADVVYVTADISVREDRENLLARVRERFGALHVLVNNAGIAPRERRDITDMAEESFDEVLAVNLRGPWFLTQAVARWMLEQKRQNTSWQGCIVTVSSVSATLASVNRGEYCIAKAGLAMATRLWALRLAGTGIPVYEVRPGIVATDMTAGVKEKYDTLIDGGLVPQKRWGEPTDVGRAVAMLARGELGFSTGQVLMVDGGLTLGKL